MGKIPDLLVGPADRMDLNVAVMSETPSCLQQKAVNHIVVSL